MAEDSSLGWQDYVAPAPAPASTPASTPAADSSAWTALANQFNNYFNTLTPDAQGNVTLPDGTYLQRFSSVTDPTPTYTTQISSGENAGTEVTGTNPDYQSQLDLQKAIEALPAGDQYTYKLYGSPDTTHGHVNTYTYNPTTGGVNTDGLEFGGDSFFNDKLFPALVTGAIGSIAGAGVLGALGSDAGALGSLSPSDALGEFGGQAALGGTTAGGGALPAGFADTLGTVGATGSTYFPTAMEGLDGAGLSNVADAAIPAADQTLIGPPIIGSLADLAAPVAAGSGGLDLGTLATALGYGGAGALTLNALSGGVSPPTGESTSLPDANGNQGGPSGNGQSYSDANYSANNGLDYSPPSSSLTGDWPAWAQQLVSNPANLLKLGTSGLSLLSSLLSKRSTGTGAATNPKASVGGTGANGLTPTSAGLQSGLTALANRSGTTTRTYNPYPGNPITLMEQGGGWNYFPTTTVPGMATGGPVLGSGLAQLAMHNGPGMVQGPGDGQSDQVPANLSPGEFVVDADSVAALGNGDPAAGAARLEQFRQNLRAHKRSAPKTAIPPKARSIQSYLEN